MPSYITYNGPMQTTGVYAPVATGTAVKTMLQVKAPAAAPITVWKWGIDFDGSGTVPIRCELLETGAVGATLTAHAAAGVQPYGLSSVASQVQLSTTGTGYAAAAANASEGPPTVSRIGALNSVLPGNSDRNEWSLGREFVVPPGNILRVRVLAAASVNALCYVCWDE